MEGYFLQNSDNEYLKTLDTANGKLEFTNDVSEAINYINRPGGQWSADNETIYLNYHYKDEYGDKVTSLHSVYREWDE